MCALYSVNLFHFLGEIWLTTHEMRSVFLLLELALLPLLRIELLYMNFPAPSNSSLAKWIIGRCVCFYVTACMCMCVGVCVTEKVIETK